MARKTVSTIVTLCLLVTAFVLSSPTQSVHAAGVVGDGTAPSCTESALLTALNGGGAVTFNCGVSPVTIVLTAEYTVAQDTGIDGGGLITLSGGDTNRVFVLTEGLELTLQNLSVTHGFDFNYGGGVLNQGGVLNVINSSFDINSVTDSGGGGSSGGGIYNTGILNVTDSTFSNNSAGAYGASGGAIRNSGTVKITNSTFVSNSAGGRYGSGGAVQNSGVLTVINSTFFANRASAFAPPSIGASGGAINNSGTLTIIHSTIAANEVASYFNQGLAGSGITNSAGAVGATLINSIVATNIGADSCSGIIGDGGGNLRWPNKDTSCPGTAGDPVLGPLADNGGNTMTHALYPLSRAIDLVSAAQCMYEGELIKHDQRGLERPLDGNADTTADCDAGAYEYDPSTCAGVAPEKPQLRKPKDGAIKAKQRTTLQWDDLACTTRFAVTVRQDSTAGKRVARVRDLRHSKFKVKGLEKGHSYHWRVKACNSSLCTKSDWSHFTIQP